MVNYKYYDYYSPNTNSNVYTFSDFNSAYLKDGGSWVLYAKFKLNTLTNEFYKSIVGSAYTTAYTTSIFGLWISPSPNNLVHLRNGYYHEGQYNGDTTLSVKKANTWYEVIVKYNSNSKRQLIFSLREVDNPSETLQSSAFASTDDYVLLGNPITFTAGGWQNNASELFPGNVQVIKIGRYINDKILSDIFGQSNFSHPRGFTGVSFTVADINNLSIGRNITVISSNTSVISVSGSGTNWALALLAVGSATITCTVSDVSGFYTTVTSSVTINVTKSVTTVTISGGNSNTTTIVKKYVPSGTISFGELITTDNTETEYFIRTFGSNNTLIVTIPNTASAFASIIGSGTTTLNMYQSETTNFTAFSGSNIITIVVVGPNNTYSLAMPSLDLSEINLSSTIFTNCNMTGANLYGTTFNSSTDLSTSTLNSIRSGRIIGFTTRLPSGYKMI